jgi:hypothetical protein
MTQDTSNGLLVHYQRASDKRYFLDFYDFTGALHSHNDLTANFYPVITFKKIQPFNYTLQGGIYLTDPTSFVTHVFDVNTFNYVKDLTNAPNPVLGITSNNGVFQYLGQTIDGIIYGYSDGAITYYNPVGVPSMNYPCLVGTDVFSFGVNLKASNNLTIYKNGKVFATLNNVTYGGVDSNFSKMTPSGEIYIALTVTDNQTNNTRTTIYRWYNNSLTIVYDETMPTYSFRAYVFDIEFDYNNNIYLAMLIYDGSTNTSALQIWQVTGASSHSVFASIDSATGPTVYSAVSPIKMTSYYTQTNIGSAVANGVYLTAQQQASIPAYKRKIYNAMIK